MTTQRDPADELAKFARLISDEREHEAPRIDPVIRRRRRRVGLIVTAAVLTAILATGGGYTAWALNAPLGTPTMSAQEPTVAVPGAAGVTMPADAVSAISVSGGDAYLGAGASGIWAATGTDEARPLASVTKLITALVVLDAAPLSGPDDAGPTLSFSKTDHDLYDEYYVQGVTVVAMPTGSSMSLRDALSTMLIPSASNYAHAVSTWAFGSISGFASAADEWLAAHGLTGTTIVEPTGTSARNTSTPSDLIAIGKLAASEPTVTAIVGTASLTLPDLDVMYNTNDLLGVDGITGLKTGNLGPGSYNLLYTASLDVGAPAPLQVTGVVLGAFSRDTVGSIVRAQLQSIRSGFHDVELATSGQVVGELSTAWGARAELVIAGSRRIFTWSDTPIEVTMNLRDPQTYADGEAVGTLTWTAGPETATADVVISGEIEPPDEWWRLTHPDELGG